MFDKNTAVSVQEYIKAVPDDRKSTFEFLHHFIQESAPSLKPRYAYNMIGYGSFQYSNYKKEIVPWPVVALANQKNYISIYVCALDDGHYIAEKYKDQLGKVSVGKSCIRIKKLEDVNLGILKTVIKAAELSPGLN